MSEFNIHVGAGAKRLERRNVLNELTNPQTQQFLLNSGLRPGMRVLDIGCGLGIMSAWIAEVVGETGSVLALDSHLEHLAIAEEVAQEAKIKNIQFCEQSPKAIKQLSERFDFIYSRFVLVHTNSPSHMVESVYTLLNPGGIFACESVIIGREFCYPSSEEFAKWSALSREVYTRLEKDPDTGMKLAHYMSICGFELIFSKLYQPVLKTQAQRREMILNDLQEQGALMRELALLDDEELASLHGDLTEYCEEPGHFIAYSHSCQLAGIKPKSS